MKNLVGYIHENTLKSRTSKSGKALALTVRFGYSSKTDRIEWFPVSQLEIGSSNECGWCRISIPYWLIKSKALEKAAFIDIENA